LKAWNQAICSLRALILCLSSPGRITPGYLFKSLWRDCVQLARNSDPLEWGAGIYWTWDCEIYNTSGK